ncbi:MAG: hypothetical protein ACO3UU_05195 [Minisyncoccia bacterium]
MLRTMKPKDVDKVMLIAKEHFDSVDMESRGFTYREDHAKEYIEHISKSEEYVPIVHEKDGVIDGIIFFQMNYSPYNKNDLCASEHVWYVKKGESEIYRSKLFMDLLKSSVDLLNKLNVSLITISLPETVDIGQSVGRFLKRNKFLKTDSVYKRRLNNVSI